MELGLKAGRIKIWPIESYNDNKIGNIIYDLGHSSRHAKHQAGVQPNSDSGVICVPSETHRRVNTL